MARQKRAKVDKSGSAQREISADIWSSSFNLRLLVVSLVVIAAGFVFLSRGSITLAPILLVLGYCVMVPFAIVYRPKSSKEKFSRKD